MTIVWAHHTLDKGRWVDFYIKKMYLARVFFIYFLFILAFFDESLGIAWLDEGQILFGLM
jgi:hypothetical protein